ncbi:MAG TPA: AbiH family protein [Bacteroidales bacterium]|nr:AbiH family protein [Candidatus Paceibacterota bacterium]HPS72170.1 AbiH family protein [Bacteroidales bacterium]
MSENENPNKLFIIGNGFDLAHDLKTRYEDFLFWYLKKVSKREKINDGIIENDTKLNWEIESISDFFSRIKYSKDVYNSNKIIFSYPFFEKITKNYLNQKWVDIEQEYFKYLINLYRQSESRGEKYLLDEVKKLNDQFSKITTELENYLNSFKEDIVLENELRDHFIDIFKLSNSKKIENNSIILNFNYTNTISLYLPTFHIGNIKYNPLVINIHGDLYNNENIIFGYGDEDDPLYEKLERLNENELLKHFKSFGYFKNEKYQTLNNFIESSNYDVYIMGHSCGISDRVLLSTIFSHPNCNKIQIFYHQKSETENDFFEKTQQISRHFKAGMKNEMRKKIVPFSECKPLVSFKN